MDPQVILILTYVVAGALVAGYIWFMVWRIRVDRRKKTDKAEAKSADKPLSPLRQMLAEQAAADEAAGATAGAGVGPAMPLVAPEAIPMPTAVPASPTGAPIVSPAVPQPEPPSTTTVVDALAGIKLPNDLAPLTTLSERFGVADRIAFWTDTAPAETVTGDFTGELERLGYKVVDFDSSTKAAHRDGVTLLMAIYAEAHMATTETKERLFPSVPEGAVVVDVWVPATT